MRILGWYLILLAIALIAALTIQRSYMLDQVVVEADLILDREVEELRLLAGGINPVTNEPFAGDVRAIFETFLARNVPLAGEGVVTIVDAAPFASDVVGQFFRGNEILDHWRTITVTERAQAETDDGPVRWLAVPLVSDDETTTGVFVVAVFLQTHLNQVDQVVRIGALVLGSVFVLASVGAWLAAGDVLRPLRQLTDTARSISETDLTQRITVDGDDEIAAVATTFNEMLDRLEEAFDTQRRFVDDASHELRTPITVIRGQLEVLGDDPADRETTMTLVNGELDRMSRIVDDLLVLARSEQPDFISPHPIDLAEFIDEMAVKASAFTASAVTVTDTEPAVFQGDRQRLTQAIMNLARNAVEHGSADVEVSVGGTVNGRYVRLLVSDNGPGIPDEVQARLFERFYRGIPGKRRTDGAGLGLSIVRAIAEGHGGTVELDTGDEGTRFTLVLPAIAVEDGAET